MSADWERETPLDPFNSRIVCRPGTIWNLASPLAGAGPDASEFGIGFQLSWVCAGLIAGFGFLRLGTGLLHHVVPAQGGKIFATDLASELNLRIALLKASLWL